MWDVLYAVDASTSMGKPSKLRGAVGEVKVEAVKKGILQVASVSQLPYGARVGVMAFRAPTKEMGMMVDSTQVTTQRLLPLTPIQDLRAKPDILRGALDAMKVGGATPTGEGLKAAVEMLHDSLAGAERRIKKAVLVTDDKSNFGPRPESVINAELVRRAIIDVVAVEKVRDREVFEALAARSGGRLRVVTDALGLRSARDPLIPDSEPGEPDPLVEEAQRVAKVLELTDRSAPSYRGLLTAAAAVRAKLEQKLRNATTLEGAAMADVDLVVNSAVNDPKWPRMSMKEFADRVWSNSADLAKLQALKDSYRRAIGLLPA